MRWEDYRVLACKQTGGIQTGYQTRGRVTHVTFCANNLPGKKQLRPSPKLHSWLKQFGCIDVRVAVNLPVTEEFGALQPGDHTQDSLLLAILEVILKSDDVIRAGPQILLAKLNHLFL